jgi:hypothetical protein
MLLSFFFRGCCEVHSEASGNGPSRSLRRRAKTLASAGALAMLAVVAEQRSHVGEAGESPGAVRAGVGCQARDDAARATPSPGDAIDLSVGD